MYEWALKLISAVSMAGSMVYLRFILLFAVAALVAVSFASPAWEEHERGMNAWSRAMQEARGAKTKDYFNYFINLGKEREYFDS